MKFTSEMLMKAMGLVVGDYIRIGTKELEKYTFLVGDEDGLMLIYEDYEYPICYLLDRDFEILPKPKKVGDLKCWEIGGSINCPLRFICDCSISNDSISTKDNLTLYQILKLKSDNSYQDQEIHDLLKKRLDKEVEEC